MRQLKGSHKQLPDTYLRLVQRFALRPLRTESEHKTAVGIVSSLMDADDDNGSLDSGSSDYLDTLLLLVNKYEDEHYLSKGDLSPQDALRALMGTNKLTQSDVARAIGATESTVSMFLNGTRDLSKSHIRALADRFALPTSVFI